LHARADAADDVPCVCRDECCVANGLEDEPVRSRIRLVGAHLVHAEDTLDKRVKPGIG
jgi:hypothetical protein